jgi:hypothetical protein
MDSIKRLRFHGCALASRNKDANTALVSMMKIVVGESTKERSVFAISSHVEPVNLYISAFGPSPCFVDRLPLSVQEILFRKADKGPGTAN